MTSHPRGPLGKGQKDARGRVPENEKIENSPIVLKIATGTKNYMRNSKIIIPNVKNQPFTLGEGQKMLGDEKIKSGSIDLKIATGIRNFMKNSKIKVPNLKNEPLTTPMPHPSKIYIVKTP